VAGTEAVALQLALPCAGPTDIGEDPARACGLATCRDVSATGPRCSRLKLTAKHEGDWSCVPWAAAPIDPDLRSPSSRSTSRTASAATREDLTNRSPRDAVKLSHRRADTITSRSMPAVTSSTIARCRPTSRPHTLITRTSLLPRLKSDLQTAGDPGQRGMRPSTPPAPHTENVSSAQNWGFPRLDRGGLRRARPAYWPIGLSARLHSSPRWLIPRG